tara:strand:+ start:965 stop:1429 length:465 start_codon:yes stop_codon:yes gene_type:complete
MEIMDKYEINVWKDAELLSKEVVEFASNKECYDYVTEKHYAPGTWTGSHQNKNGVTLNRPPPGIRITWAKRTKDNFQHYKPKKLSAEEKKLQRELYDSITPETIQELGPNEMYAKVCRNYGPNPNATGYNEFPNRKSKTYIDGDTGEKYTKDGV